MVTADYCISEVEKNVRKYVAVAAEWKRIVLPAPGSDAGLAKATHGGSLNPCKYPSEFRSGLT
jgi:hypothetical protein